MSIENIADARQRRLDAELMAFVSMSKARASHPAGKANKAPYGYKVCSTCGYEREIGVPCGLPCV